MYAVAITTCLVSEYVVVRLRRRPVSVGDYSAVVTALLLVMILPPRFPLYGVVLGSVFSIVVGKQIFGGIGYNIFNPALIGRAFLAATYPVFISQWLVPTLGLGVLSGNLSGIDTVSGATPLASMKFDGMSTPISSLFFGLVPGSIGETSSFLLIIGAVYLIVKKYIKWRISVSILGTVFVLGEIFHLIDPQKFSNGFFHLFAGGLMLGALYMATDMVTSPITKKGCVIFGVGIGVLVILIRLFGGLPEGVMYAILFMNAFAPIINRSTKPKILGTGGSHE
jgi:electron transport complex protein RnfD